MGRGRRRQRRIRGIDLVRKGITAVEVLEEHNRVNPFLKASHQKG